MSEIFFKKKKKIEIDETPIENGSLLFSTDTPEIFLDDENERKSYGAVNEDGINNAVRSYLEENPVMTTPIDKTLEKDNYAADSKTVGNKIKEINNEIKKINDNFYNIKKVYVNDYGALGDGSSDDSDAIQNAINSSPNIMIMFNPGIYMISKPIDIPDKGIIINLCGSIIRASKNIDYMLGFNKVERYEGIEAIIKNGSIDGNLLANNCINLYRFGGNLSYLSIIRFKNYGIYETGESISPQKVIDNICIYGGAWASDGWSEVNRTGIRLSHDSIVNNLQIGRCQIGMKIESNYVQINNIHIWTQTSNTKYDTEDYFKKFIGIKLGNEAQVSGTNVYLDRLKYGFYSDNYNNVSYANNITIYGLNYCCGSDVTNGEDTEAYIMKCRGNHYIVCNCIEVGNNIKLNNKIGNSLIKYFPIQKTLFTGIGKENFKNFDIHDIRNSGDIVYFNGLNNTGVTKTGIYLIGKFKTFYDLNGGLKVEVNNSVYGKFSFECNLIFKSDYNFKYNIYNSNIYIPNEDYDLLIKYGGKEEFEDLTYDVLNFYIRINKNNSPNISFKVEKTYGSYDIYMSKVGEYIDSLEETDWLSCG